MIDLRFYSVKESFRGDGKEFFALRKQENLLEKQETQEHLEKYIVQEEFPKEQERYYLIGCANEASNILIPAGAGSEVLKDKEDYMEIIQYIIRKKIKDYTKNYKVNLESIVFPTKKQLKEIIKDFGNDIIEMKDDKIYHDDDNFIVNILYAKTKNKKVVMIIRIV